MADPPMDREQYLQALNVQDQVRAEFQELLQDLEELEHPRRVELDALMQELGEEMAESPRHFLQIARRKKIVEENPTDALRIMLCAAAYFENKEELWMEAYGLSGDQAGLVLERAMTLNPESKLFPIVDYVAQNQSRNWDGLWPFINGMINNWKAEGSSDGWQAWTSSAIFLSDKNLHLSCQNVIWETGDWPIMPVKLRNRGYYLTKQDFALAQANRVPEVIDDIRIASSESSEEAVEEDNENRA